MTSITVHLRLKPGSYSKQKYVLFWLVSVTCIVRLCHLLANQWMVCDLK